jgi:hypothetical protein
LRGAAEKLRVWLFIAAVLAVFLCISPGCYLAYPCSSYTWTYYPEAEPSFSFSIEGDLHPLEQKIVLESYNSSGPASDPVITINGKTTLHSGILDKTTIIEVDFLTNGVNSVSTNSSSGAFRLTLNYTPQWKPVVKRLDITNLQAGEMSAFSIVSEDRNADQLIVESKLVIREDKDGGAELHNLTFEGDETAIIIHDPGNYLVNLKVSDGIGWSDTYKTSFTAHIVKTSQELRTDPVDPVIGESSWGPPAVIGENDSTVTVFLKKYINGFHVTYLNTKNRLKHRTATMTMSK